MTTFDIAHENVMKEMNEQRKEHKQMMEPECEPTNTQPELQFALDLKKAYAEYKGITPADFKELDKN